MRNASTKVLSRQKLELLKTFQFAKSVDIKLKTFKKIEKLFDDSELGLECLALAIASRRSSPEQVLSFGNRALRILIDNDTKNIPCFGNTFTIFSIATGKDGTSCTYYHNSSFYIAHVCNLLASACRKLKRYDESLSYLNRANRNLSTLLEDDDDTSCGSNCLLYTLLVNQELLYNLKFDTGRFDEAVLHLRKVLEIEESMMEEGCIRLGNTNEQVCDTYMMLMKYKEALPFCLKAMEIYTKHLGRYSVEVARMMRQHALIYHDFKEYEKALEQNQLSQDILKNTTPNSPEFLSGENDTGYILIGLCRYEEGIDVLKRVVSHTDTERSTQGHAFVNMATALFHLGKRAEAKKPMKTAQTILGKKGRTHPVSVAIGFGDMSVLYEKMNDFGKATFLLRRAPSIPKIPQKLLVEGSARLFSLISLSSKEKEGIAYIEDVVEKLKHSFGPEHCEVGYGYRNLGAAYLKSGQEELAVKSMVKAKDIMDVTLGPRHLDSLQLSQTLAETYATMRRYDPAIEIQANVVDGLEGLEPREQELLDIAVKHLNKMKKRVAESRMGASPQSKDDDDLSAKISKCSISDNEKVLK